MSARKRHSLLFVALMSIALAGLTGSARAAETFSSSTLKASVSMNTTMITPLTRRFVGRITVQAGAKKTVVGISASGPHFRRMFNGKLTTEGETIRAVRLRSVGPARRVILDGTSGGNRSDDTCARVEVGPQQPRGGDWGSRVSRGVILQPRQSVTIEVDFDIASDAPWFGTNYAPVFRVGPVNRDVGDGTMLFPKGTRMLKNEVALSPPIPTVTGPFAARIDIANTGGVYSKARGVVKGSIFPAEAGRTINFAASRLNNWPRPPSPPVAVGSAVTAADGTFTLTNPIFTNKGFYAVMPSYPAQSGDLLPDAPCPFLYVGKYVGKKTVPAPTLSP